MKTIRLNKIAQVAMTLAIFAGAAGIVIAGETSTKGGTSRVIPLHAPNNVAQTVTIWTPTPTPRSTGTIANARNGVQQVIELRAPNNPAQTVTLWMSGTEKKIQIAPLK